ncbi:MAG: hypothetical protein LN412_08485 [Candidatus Thermoplasmatota archaeon]|nr:hypothetical protein [Candidatus Thermoplasmatota archaeon]
MGAAGRPKGRGILLTVRIVSVLASLLFSALLITTILLAMPGNLEFIPPEMEEGDLRFEDGILYLDTSFTLGNGGYHDITNFSVTVQAIVQDDLVVTDYATTPVNIPVGERREVGISIPVDLEPLLSSGYLLFEPANVSFTIGMSGTTTRGLIDFAASVTFEQQFDPLISDFSFGVLNLSQDSGEWVLTVPYTVDAASFLQEPANATFSILDDTGTLLGQANATIDLGVPVAGNLTFDIDSAKAMELLADPQDLTIQVTLELPGDLTFTFETVVTLPGG